MKLNTNFYIYISCAKCSPERSGFSYTSLRKLLMLQAALCSERGIRYRKIWVEILILCKIDLAKVFNLRELRFPYLVKRKSTVYLIWFLMRI